MTGRRAFLVSLSLALAALAGAAVPAEARVLDQLVGKVALSKAPLPSTGPAKAYLRALAQGTRGRAVFWQDESDGAWHVHYAAVLSRPIWADGATLDIYDISHGQRLVGTREVMMFGKHRILTGSFTLARSEVRDPNSRMMFLIEDGGRVLAKRDFYIQGKVERRAPTGPKTIDFTDDEPLAARSAPPQPRASHPPRTDRSARRQER
jgi:hypothetical protein